MEGMRSFAGFAAAFAVLFLIWLNQYKFFRRYGLQDGPTLWLNALLLFLVVFFVYPLKFLFSFLFHIWTGGSNQVKMPDGELAAIINEGQDGPLMMIYAAGYAAVFAVFGFLYWRAYTQRASLNLSAQEIFDTASSILEMGWQVAIGGLSFALAWSGKPAWAGLTFCLIGPVLTAHGLWRGSRRRRLLAG